MSGSAWRLMECGQKAMVVGEVLGGAQGAGVVSHVL